MKKPTKKITDDECRILEEDCPNVGKTRIDLLRRKVKRISPGKGKLVSELIREMRC
jgi:hypothetical protein